MNTPGMYDANAQFAGISLSVDPINRQRTESSDNVMAMFHEEQPFTWEFVRPYIEKAFVSSKGSTDFLDVGTGSGVFSILVATHFPGSRILAIDKSLRAIEVATRNAETNAVSFQLRRERYSTLTIPAKSVKVIGLYPPYHLYPEEVSDSIPQHARGGSNGQEEFINQLFIAGHHLAEDGIIFFNQMCLGDERGPAFVDYIQQLIPQASIEYTNVFPRIRTEQFLRGVYGDRHPEYLAETANAYPWLYYTVGVIHRDSQGRIQEVGHTVDLAGRSWEDRILLHREIAAHEQR